MIDICIIMKGKPRYFSSGFNMVTPHNSVR